MAATTYWLKLACFLLAIVIIRSASSKLNIKTLRKLPCDVEENSTNSTIVFNCYRRGLKKVPTGITKNATSLFLAENKIKNVSVDAFHDLQNLTHLDLNWINNRYGVNITKGVFSNLTNLQELNLNGNSLRDVPEELPSRLRVLKLDENKIVSLNLNSFSNVRNVTKLFLSKNCYYWNPCDKVYDIGNGSFSGLKNLQILTLSYNNLTQVPRGLPISLNELELASNRIQYVAEDDFKELKNLRVLQIQGNCPRCQNAPYPCVPCPNSSLEIHPQAFDSLVHLDLLHLGGNSLRSIKSSWFEHLTNLTKLFLTFNFLSSAIADGGFLTNLPLLETLDLSYNFDLKAYPETLRLAANFSKLVSLKTLHIEGYVFREIIEETLSPLYNLTNLSVLNMGVNFIVHTNSTIFNKLHNIKLIYLSENRLYPVSVSTPTVQYTSDNLRPVFSKPPLLGYTSGKTFVYEISHRLVKPECFATGHVLDLSRNNLFFISPKQFEGFGNISCLNLSRNGFAAALNGTEFTSLPKLRYLDLSYNKIDPAYNNAFKELQRLEVLDLSFNAHYFTVSGVTHNLRFLENLPALRVLNLSSNSISRLTWKELNSSSLNELQFQHNELGKLWRSRDTSYENLFKYLTNLTYLDISYNKIGNIPPRVFKNLPQKIHKLRLSQNVLTYFNWSMLNYFQELQELDLSHNQLYYVSENLAKDTKTLCYLNLKYNRISHLSNGFLDGAKRLQILDLSHNRLNIINQTTFPLRPENYMKTLFLQGNPFHCTCDLLEFILWLENSDVNIPKLATTVTCSIPAQRKGQGIIFFDIKECINDQQAFLIYFLSSTFLFCITFIAVAMHLFYWDASYTLYYLKAKLKGYHYLKSTNSIYDAFVTYDTKDPLVSDWVLNHLQVQLEERGERPLPICLEERDWTPGIPVLDNLSQSIRQSRKTVFVLTEAYVNSGSFKMAAYLAHQRLLDDSEDVIVLLLLEPVLQHSPFLRLRRRLCGQSILEWPKTPSAEPWFWQCLRNAIRLDNQAMYSEIYSRYFPVK